MLIRIRRVAVAVLLLQFIVTSSACNVPQGGSVPTPVPTVEPQTIAVADAMTIAYLCDQHHVEGFESQYDLPYMQLLLRNRGWNVQYKIEGAITEEQTGELDVIATVNSAIAAGTACDGYIVDAGWAKELFEAGLAQDLAAVLPVEAPALYRKYASYFAQSTAGLPLSSLCFNKGKQTALLLQKDIATGLNMQIKSVSDVWSYLDGNDKMQIGSLPINFSSTSLLEAWAGEQGYYSLFIYGIDGGLYANLADQQCTIVPVENIPGFTDFFDRWLTLFMSNRILDNRDQEKIASENVAGYITTLEGIDTNFLNSHKKSGRDYVAYPIGNCLNPAQLLNEPVLLSELAIASGSTKAQQIVKFSQWALTDQDNYDLVRYGTLGKDYRIAGTRLEYLNNGNPLTKEDWGQSSAAFFRHNFFIFQDADMERATVYMPDNYEALIASSQPIAQPLWDKIHFKYTFNSETPFSDINSQFTEILRTRARLLSGVMNESGIMGDRPDSNSADCLAKLDSMSETTSRIIEVFQQRIQQLMDKQGK